ncbi:MAG: phosphoenolpyruvate carboxykinase [Acidimicrobiia bacterium]
MEIRAKSTLHNPSEEELRDLTEQQATARWTEFGNLNITTEVTARSKGSTFVVNDDPSQHTDPVIDRSTYAEMADRQDQHLTEQDVIVLDGYISDHPDARVAVRLVVEIANANLAAMQRLLYFPPDEGFEPEFHVIYTPSLDAPGFPNDRLIAVDLDNWVSRVFNADYFGESKMSGLRMWDALMYLRGGLAMHCGSKVIEVNGTRSTGLVVGLSGTGKTTTTFSQQGDVARPVQDDFVALFPDSRVYGTEAGTFAKVYGLTPEREPVVWAGVQSSRSLLENVAIDPEGRLDFFDTSHTENSRAICSADDLPGFLAPRFVETADFLLILNRNQGIIPAVARLDRQQAAAYFMLGETTGTSAGGAAEAGKSLRVPGTNPFFVYLHEQQANRLYELLDGTKIDVYLLNTGWIGGADPDQNKEVTPQHSSTIIEGIAAGSIAWEEDPDFGYQVASNVEDFDDLELLQPRRFYQRVGRSDEYADRVEELRRERKAHFGSYEQLLPEIARAI